VSSISPKGTQLFLRREIKIWATRSSLTFTAVMAGLDPAIHVFICPNQDVDARHKAGHDDL
jgi:hypothetical protein